MNQEFYQHVAVITALIIAFAFLLGTPPFKTRKRLTLVSEPPSPQWYAGECFMFLKATIMTCNTPDELKKCADQVEAFYAKEFRASITVKERKRYYIRLHEAIALKEELLGQAIPA